MPNLRSPFGPGFTDSAADELATALSVLADPHRLKILALLNSHGPLSIKQLTERLPLRQPTVTHHVMRLEHLGLIGKTKQGALRICKVDHRAVADVASALSPWQDS